MRIFMSSSIAAAFLLSGCVVEPAPHPYYAPTPYYPAVAPAPADAYYDGYYGPYVDGYWNGGVYVFFGNDHRWHRDDGRHFGRGPGPGYFHVHGSGHRPNHW